MGPNGLPISVSDMTTEANIMNITISKCLQEYICEEGWHGIPILG